MRSLKLHKHNSQIEKKYFHSKYFQYVSWFRWHWVKYLLGSLLLLVPLNGSATEPRSSSLGISSQKLALHSAIKQTLALNPSLKIQQQQVIFNQGTMQIARGEFNPQLQVSFNLAELSEPLSHADKTSTGEAKQDSATSGINLAAPTLLRSGLTLTPSIEVSRIEDQTFGQPNQNNAIFSFETTIPLLKGLGQAVVANKEHVAVNEYNRAVLDLRHTISENILLTVQAYWAYLVAEQRLDIHHSSKEDAQQLLHNIGLLVEADEKPASDLNQLQANVADQLSAEFEAEQRLLEARHDLGLAIGLSLSEIIELPATADSFPTVESNQTFDLDLAKYLSLAEHKRADLQSALLGEDSIKMGLPALKNALKPQLDFTVNVGYTSLKEDEQIWGSLDSGGDFNVMGSLEYVFPVGNDNAKGALHCQLATLTQLQLTNQALLRKIKSEVTTAHQWVKRSQQQLEQAEVAVAAYRKAVGNEKLKFNQGMSTIDDIISITDRYKNAMLIAVGCKQNYANSIAQLRFKTGTLATMEDNVTFSKEQKLPKVTFIDL